MQFYSLKVREVRRETPECVSVSFEVPENQQDIFQYKQGQYLTIRTHLNGEEVRRSYSVCTAPFENDLRVAVKKVEDGLFSTFANDVLKAGDTLEVMPPEGRFSLETNAAAQHLYVAFAAGSGITPIISILKAVLHNEPGSRFMLFYGNRGFDHRRIDADLGGKILHIDIAADLAENLIENAHAPLSHRGGARRLADARAEAILNMVRWTGCIGEGAGRGAAQAAKRRAVPQPLPHAAHQITMASGWILLSVSA